MNSEGFTPSLSRVEVDTVGYWTDPGLVEHFGVRVCLSERVGGVSDAPFLGLNLAAHVGDDPVAVDENRRLLLCALGSSELACRLTTAEQVHGATVVVVDGKTSGSGARAHSGPAPIAACDALITSEPDTPLLLCYADCVPVVLACPGGAGVVHAGWRGALSRIPARAVVTLAEECACAPSDVIGYIGAHIGACHYEVDDEIMSQFVNVFGTVARAESGGLDLGAAVNASLTDAGVDPCNIARLGTCTAETTERFYSHRAEGGFTGRHGALAYIPSR